MDAIVVIATSVVDVIAEDRGSFNRDSRRNEVAAGMKQVFIGAGSVLGVAPGELAGMIYSEANIKSGNLGKIRIFPKHSLVQVKEGDEHKVIDALKGQKLRGKSFPCRLDRDL